MKWELVRKPVMLPPLFLLIGAVIVSIVSPDFFLKKVNQANSWMLGNFSWLFSSATLLMVLTCVVVLFSPIGKIKFGGAKAEPLLNRWQLFSIILSTTVAVGILFWGTAEPLYHFAFPPASSGIDAQSKEAANFSLSTMFLHWSLTPYAIYCIPSLMFALAYYNSKRPFSLSSTLFPIFKASRITSVFIDAICLFALVAGMAASLSAGILSLSGGVQNFTNLAPTPLVLGIICLIIVLSFILSAASGLFKGIKTLASINMVFFAIILIYVVIFGPLEAIGIQFLEGISTYFSQFFQKSLLSITHPKEEWSQSWTVFYWANWLAWAPVTALFLGRIAYGYTVRQFMIFNWLIPSFFSILYMSIFSGTTLHYELSGTISLVTALNENGPQSVVYKVLNHMPYAKWIVALFVFTIYMSYVTAADSNTEAMAGISTAGISPTSPNPPKFLKIIWGLVVGLVAFVMVNASGINGIKMLSNLGGFPALFLILIINIGLIKLLFNPKKYLKK